MDRPSYRPRAPRIIVDLEQRQARVDGHTYSLSALSKTTWLVLDTETGATSWFRVGADADGEYAVKDAEDPSAASVGAAWVWGCRQAMASPLPRRPSLH